MKNCSRCNGWGTVETPYAEGYFKESCPRCNGSGEEPYSLMETIRGYRIGEEAVVAEKTAEEAQSGSSKQSCGQTIVGVFIIVIILGVAFGNDGGDKSPRQDRGSRSATPEKPRSPATAFEGERFPDTRTRILSFTHIRDLNDANLRYAINEIYARHGFYFQTRAIRDNFAQFSWYRPRLGVTTEEIEQGFTDPEKQNLKALSKERDRRRGGG